MNFILVRFEMLTSYSLIVSYKSVFQKNNSAAVRGIFLRMGNLYNGHPFGMQLFKEIHNDLTLRGM